MCLRRLGLRLSELRSECSAPDPAERFAQKSNPSEGCRVARTRHN